MSRLPLLNKLKIFMELYTLVIKITQKISRILRIQTGFKAGVISDFHDIGTLKFK